jgi:hypothetical protein
MWLTASSITSGRMPSSASPVTNVRRRSCSRHGGIFIVASSRLLVFDPMLIGKSPFVVKMNPPSPCTLATGGINWAKRELCRPSAGAPESHRPTLVATALDDEV